ncbi:MAG: hypothetical protein HYS17_03825 [Micavibrio aeruginosavorus]|uniref:Uncharacterized protein n=1 Tax=Micavibrio aeruginosavorus TaxID=349221 RepID=A0A7T5UHY2_9BACT|nr:MAG: hypothetical protein HYS17_03825 [Micavibrio aeruginosavorus]
MLTDNTYGLPRPRPRFVPATASPYLDGVLASTVFDLDATIAASYGGSGQTWANLTAAPADGSAKTAYDFYLGATSSAASDDPAFNGTPGDSAAYFSVDGGDFWRLAGAKPDFLDALHKTTGGTNWWLAMTIRWATSGNGLFGTGNASSAPGMNLRTTSADGSMNLRMRGDTATVTFASPAGLLTNGGDAVIIHSFNKDTSIMARWVNTRTGTTGAFVPNATSSDASGAGEIFSRGDGNFFMASGARLYSCAMGNEYLDDTKAAAIIAHLNARHNRTYA